MSDTNEITILEYELAIASNACNVSGVVKSLARLIDKIWVEARALNKGTDYVNQHPLVRLHAEQISFLASGRDWSEAMRYCEAKVAELKKAELVTA